MTTNHFVLYSNCVPVKGAKESIICDLQRHHIFEIPNVLFDILQANKGRTVEVLKSHYEHQYDEGIDSYFDVFEKEELGFFTENPEYFPELNLQWYSPKKIHNAIVEIEQWRSYDVLSVFQQLLELDCSSIQLRILKYIDFDRIKEIVDATTNSKLKNIEIFLPYNSKYKITDVEKLIISNPRIQPVIFYAAPIDEVRSNERLVLDKNITYTTQKITRNQKDTVHFKNFVSTIKIFSEAQHHNIALNRKVSIDTEGTIKNYTSHHKSYGNVNQDSIAVIVSSEEFQQKWNISNNEIEKCRDCQFRYFCMFNSDIIQKENQWVRTENCGFNPYTNSWNHA